MTVLLFRKVLPLALAAASVLAAASPFCLECPATRDYYRSMCDRIVKEKADGEVIFTAGYLMRDLVAGYRIFGDRRYLDTAVAYADKLLTKQSERGYWLTGYGRNMYLADTGSALGLFITLYDHVDKPRRARYLASVQRYVDAIEKDGLILPSGAIDVGLRGKPDGGFTGPFKEDYTISSALTGGEIFTWMYHMTKREKYRKVAYDALKWVLSHMRQDGVIPYNHPSGKSDLRKKGDKENDRLLWEWSPYLTSAYVGEGLLSFDLYCGQPQWKRELREKIKPHIEWLLRTQNVNGTWAVDGWWDQKRSPGVVNLLIWYHDHVHKDPRIVTAVDRFRKFVMVPQQGAGFGLFADGSKQEQKDRIAYDCVTGLTGRAIADMIRPGVDAKW
jgi:hypothetical protein